MPIASGWYFQFLGEEGREKTHRIRKCDLFWKSIVFESCQWKMFPKGTLPFKTEVDDWRRLARCIILPNFRMVWTSSAAFLAPTGIWKDLLHLQNVQRLQNYMGSKLLNCRNIRNKLMNYYRGKQEHRKGSRYHLAALLHQMALELSLQVLLSCGGLKQIKKQKENL